MLLTKAMWDLLTEEEADLVRSTQAAAMADLDEEELVELHRRVRRARNKWTKNYRRRASAQVGKDRSRAEASPKHARAAVKAEIFEDALARVSRRLAQAARQQADQLRTERLAAARAVKEGGGGPAGSSTPAAEASSGAARGKRKQKTPASKRGRAASRAATGRAQAKRDAR
jgi:hypothetical protein